MTCEHKNCGDGEKVWLPYYFDGRERGLRPHPYCMKCGLVRNSSSEKPHNLGYFMNIISMLSQEYKVAQVQVRLLALEMERQDMHDGYGLDRRQQEKMFVEMVKSLLNVPEQAVSELL